MIQIFKFLLGLALLFTTLQAEKPKIDPQYLPIDKSLAVSYLRDNRWYFVGTNDSYGIFFDTKTAEYDKKTKILTGWSVWFYTPYGREQYIQKAKEFNFYNSYKDDNLSYSIQKDRWSLNSNKRMILNYTDYSTEGSVVDQSTYKNPKWDEIVPGTIGEVILENLKKRYR